MSQILRGRLHALLCRECTLPLVGAQITVYRADPQGPQAAKQPELGFRELSADDAGGRSGRLATATVGDDGAWQATLDGSPDGAIEIVARLDRLPGADAELESPVYFSLGSHGLEWGQTDDSAVAELPYIISSRLWCALLARWGWWVICGRVRDAAGTTLAGLEVEAFDRDFVQDDKLGEDVTDGGGEFHIWYRKTDFDRTPFSPLINVEMTSGPDVYFKVATAGGNVLLEESASSGRLPGRENVGNCFCVELEIDVDQEPGPDYYKPLFTNVGNFHILFDFNADGTANKEKLGAGGAGWGFHRSPELRGLCPKVHSVSGLPMYYRFLYVDPVTSAEKPVTGDLLDPVLVGSKKIQWDVDSDSVVDDTFQDIQIAGSGATPPLAPGGSGPLPVHVIEPDAQGWIAVDQEALDGAFNGPLVKLNSKKIVADGGAPGSGAGNVPADPKTGATVTLIFETTTDPADPTKTQRQSDTVDVRFNNWNEVRQLDLEEFETGANGSCTGLTATVTPKYTVNHEFVRSWSLGMSSAASPWTPPPLPSGNASVAATHAPINVAAWPPCSYTVSLSSSLELTDGKTNDPGNNTPVTFCKT